MSNPKLVWHKVLDDKSELAEGRVMTVTAGNKDLCLSLEITADVKLI